MIIKELRLEHFGKFHHQQVYLRPGINIIYGANEAGKSTIHAFIQCMLFGTERMRGRGAGRDMYSKYQPWTDGKNYEGAMLIEHEGVSYRIYRSFYKDDEVFRVINQDTGKEAKPSPEGLGSLIGGLTESGYKNTISIRRPELHPDERFSLSLQNHIANLSMTGSDAIQLEKALDELKIQHKQYDTKAIQHKMRQLAEEISRLSEREKDKQQYLYNLRQTDKEESLLSNKQHQYERESRQAYLKGIRHQERLKGGLVFFALLFLVALAGRILWPILSGAAGIGFISVIIALYRNRQPSGGRGESDLPEQKEALTAKKNRLEWMLEQLDEEMAGIVPLNEQYHLYQEELEKSNEELEAIEIASETIKDLALDIHESLGSHLNQSVAQVFSEITGKPDYRIYIDEKLNIAMDNTKKYVSYQHLSTGTIDQLYFALRFLLGDIVFDGKELPIILDDIFALYDDKRLKNILDWLIRQRRPQIIIFTCHQREADILDDLGQDYNYVEL